VKGVGWVIGGGGEYSGNMEPFITRPLKATG